MQGAFSPFSLKTSLGLGRSINGKVLARVQIFWISIWSQKGVAATCNPSSVATRQGVPWASRIDRLTNQQIVCSVERPHLIKKKWEWWRKTANVNFGILSLSPSLLPSLPPLSLPFFSSPLLLLLLLLLSLSPSVPPPPSLFLSSPPPPLPLPPPLSLPPLTLLFPHTDRDRDTNTHTHKACKQTPTHACIRVCTPLTIHMKGEKNPKSWV